MKEIISKDIKAISQAIKWEKNVDETKRDYWHSVLISAQRDIEDIRYALEDRPSVAAYGESQMGKSYLIDAMLSDPDIPFHISNGSSTYDFIKEINPSEDNASIEATGLVTRFHLSTQDEQLSNKEWVKVRMLTVADLVLVLVEAWCNEVIKHDSPNIQDWLDNITQRKVTCPRHECSNPILSEVDLAYMEKYMLEADSGSGFGNINSSKLINFLRQNVGRISNEDTIAMLRLLWDENPDFNRLFDDLLRNYRSLNFQNTVYVEFKSLLKKHGTLLDVERINEMYSEPSSRVNQAQYISDASVRFSDSGSSVRMAKPFLSALSAELCINIDSEFVSERPFLQYFDILDFPGLRPKDEREESVLGIGDNLATVFRRGKVTYLFKKYSRTRRISSLLFCHNHNQSNACKLGPVLTQWVETNVGNTPNSRQQADSDLGGSPLMIVSTWFNENLKYSDERRDDNLNSRWETRFRTVLTGQVLKAKDLPTHWFNSWSAKGEPFHSLFMLRSFKFSKMIFNGWDPDAHTKETTVVDIPKFPDFLERLKDSFTTNTFVRERFPNPDALWDACATPGNDGTKLIISRLNELAPKAEEARKRKFERDLSDIEKTLIILLRSEFHDDDPAEQTRKAAKEVGRLILNIDVRCGKDPYFWSRMMEEMMIPERMIRESVFANINGNVVTQPLSGPEKQIFMDAGLSTEYSPEKNLTLLCEFLPADNRKECEEILYEIDPEISIDRLLSQTTMMASKADQVVSAIEQLWLNEFLSKRVASGNVFSNLATITSKLAELYKMLDVHKELVKGVQNIMDTIVQGKQVGIVANWLTMSLNKYVGEFGFSFINKDMMRSLANKNDDFKLNIDMDMLVSFNQGYGIDLLKQVDDVQRSLEKEKGFNTKVHEQQKLIPQYRSRWQWQHRMKAAFAITSGLRDYNIEENNELKRIIDSI